MNSNDLSEWIDLFLDRDLSDAQAKTLLDCFAEAPEFKVQFVEEVMLSALTHGRD